MLAVPIVGALVVSAAALAFAAGGFLLVMRLAGQASAWSALAQQCRASARPPGPAFRRQGARLNWTRYVGIVTVVPSHAGLYVELPRPWNFRHPPLLIPWSRLQVVRRRRRFALLSPVLELSLTGTSNGVISLGQSAADAVRPYVNTQGA